MNKKKSITGITIVILFLFLFTIYTPITAYYIPPLGKTLMAGLLWLSFIKNNTFRWVALLSFPILSLFQMAFQSASQFFQQLYFVFNLATVAALFITLYRGREGKLSKKIFYVLLVVFVINAITTYYGNIVFPGASRDLASTKYVGDLYDTYLKYNIGGFDIIYSFVLIIPLLAYRYKKTRLLTEKSLILIITLVFLMAIVKSQYTTAILFAFVSLSLFFIPLNNKPYHWVILGIIILAVVLSTKYLIAFLSFVSSISGSEQVMIRMSDLTDLTNGESLDADSDVIGRSERYTMSIKLFFSSPLWGQMFSIVPGKVGGHSFILDKVAFYGLLGIYFCVLMFKTIYKLYIKDLRGIDIYPFAMVVFIEYIMLTLLNPQPFIPFISFALPLSFYILSKEQ